MHLSMLSPPLGGGGGGGGGHRTEQICDCWRALARQLPFLYNREKKAKSVGCKIGDLRSKFAFNIRGLLNVETCAVDYGCL